MKVISHLNKDAITRLKTKLQHTYDKNSWIKVPGKYQNVKERGVVLLDKTKYVEKSFFIINTSKFKKLDKNLMVHYEAKIQGILMIHIARI